MASFGGGIGDAIIVSKLCFSLYQACTAGRKGAPDAVLALANELWACSTALDQLAAAASRPKNVPQSVEAKQITSRMISGCRTSLEELQALINKYEDVKGGSNADENSKWYRKLKLGVKKSRWMYEEENVQRIRARIGSNVEALNLLLGTFNR